MSWIVPPCADVIEPALAPEFFIDRIAAIEVMENGCARFYLCAQQLPLEASGTPQSVVTVKIVRPLVTLPSAIGILAQCLGAEPRVQKGWMPRVVS